MNWEKKICIRITARRLVGAVVMTATAVNLIIVGAAFEAAAPTFTAAPAEASPTTTPSLTSTTLAPTTPIIETMTANLAPSVTLTSTDTPTHPPTLALCVLDSYWPLYRVQPGDTLISLASVTGSSAEELRLANCLPDYEIYAGQLLYVPRLPFRSPSLTPSSTATSTPTDTPTPTPTNTTGITVTYLPTATPTATTSPPIVFQNPYVCIDFVSYPNGSLAFSVSIAPINDIKSVTLNYQRANGTTNTLPMALFSSGVYSASAIGLEGYVGNTTIPYSFTVDDNFGNRINSGEYKTSLTACLA